MKTVMILGDSWACGEYTETQRLSHRGTAQYLADAGHRVISMADPGSSNWAQLDRLAPHHPYQRDPRQAHSVHQVDCLLWFVTDPLRELTQQPQGLREYHDTRLARLSRSFDTMFQRAAGRPVLLVGGVAAIPDGVVDRYPGWRVVVQDWVRWLIPHTQVSTVHLNRGWRYPDCDPELLDYHEIEEQRASWFRWRAQHRPDTPEHRWFWPDGLHPNRLAHRRLCDELILPML